ncbi:hypothetical protein HYFRA_00007255 [Hymenoscyphus fraxineus]|uniref:Uncharacterized protein n=1 Tax=Hymenoscyphus fraxineus TaxID=746836 RepID=A0A9N9PU51_9HELO|nr:hypothetical protein HYFRA_00007255 [Hymenoscyphus fraxineus]
MAMKQETQQKTTNDDTVVGNAAPPSGCNSKRSVDTQEPQLPCVNVQCAMCSLAMSRSPSAREGDGDRIGSESSTDSDAPLADALLAIPLFPSRNRRRSIADSDRPSDLLVAST